MLLPHVPDPELPERPQRLQRHLKGVAAASAEGSGAAAGQLARATLSLSAVDVHPDIRLCASIPGCARGHCQLVGVQAGSRVSWGALKPAQAWVLIAQPPAKEQLSI